MFINNRKLKTQIDKIIKCIRKLRLQFYDIGLKLGDQSILRRPSLQHRINLGPKPYEYHILLFLLCFICLIFLIKYIICFILHKIL